MTSLQTAVAEYILNYLTNISRRMTPLDLAQLASRHFSVPMRRVNGIIRRLINDGRLEFTYDLGCTFVELPFNTPTRISERITLVPRGIRHHPTVGEFSVVIEPGAAFGDGRHPTTQLALCALDFYCGITAAQRSDLPQNVLDVGTGSGILIIAAVRLGCGRGLALDIDPVAQSEARHNVLLNGLADTIQISAEPFEALQQKYDLILANLRTPSLIQYVTHFRQHLVQGGALVVSGIRVHEKKAVMNSFSRVGFDMQWQADQYGWLGMVFQK